MSLVDNIRTITTTLYPGATFLLSSKFKANVASFDLAAIELPLIILDNELSKDNEIKKNNNILKNSKILLTILQKDDVYNTDEESETIRSNMEAIGDKLAVNIYQLPEVFPIQNQKYKCTPVFHVFNTDLTGVIIEMQVNENNVIDFCNTI